MSFAEYFSNNFLRSRRLSKLPERVKDRLRERERANEVLIRILQLLMVVMFLSLYSLAAKTGTDTAFRPVPFVLAGYAVLSVIGLIWSLRSRLPDWSVYCSILFDFTLLYTLMISFHYQYEQPASFILKAPTLLYVFIFISLRALRQEWKFVAAAGLTAAAGWLLVVIYVISVEPENTMITRSYVEYLTSNSILIGAEVDKMISILAVTAVLTFAVNASSNLLVTAIAEETAASDFSRFFDKSIAQDIRGSEQLLIAGQGDRRTMAIINIDLRGFSKLAAHREPSEVMQILSEYQSRIVPILQNSGAVIDKFMGDGIMATIAKENDGHAINRIAVEAAEAIIAESNSWETVSLLMTSNGPVQIGIGIASGDVSFGAVGQGDRLEMTVIGAPVNLSAKLEKHNKELNSRCVVQSEVWQMALSEGYKGTLSARQEEACIDGIAEKQSITVLDLPLTVS